MVEVLVLWWRFWYPGRGAGTLVEVVVLGGGSGPVVEVLLP